MDLTTLVWPSAPVYKRPPSQRQFKSAFGAGSNPPTRRLSSFEEPQVDLVPRHPVVQHEIAVLEKLEAKQPEEQEKKQRQRETPAEEQKELEEEATLEKRKKVEEGLLLSKGNSNNKRRKVTIYSKHK